MRTCAIVTLVVTACSAINAQQPRTFNDPQGRFTVQAPSGWQVLPLNADCLQISDGGAYLSVIVSGGDPGMAMAAIAHQFGGPWHSFAKVRRW